MCTLLLVCYWRTKDKKEIDFILRDKRKIMPIEVKLNLERFNNRAIKYLNGKYGLDDYRVVGLEGDLKEDEYIHPWEV